MCNSAKNFDLCACLRTFFTSHEPMEAATSLIDNLLLGLLVYCVMNSTIFLASCETNDYYIDLVQHFVLQKDETKVLLCDEIE